MPACRPSARAGSSRDLTKFTTAHPEILIHLITKIEPFEFGDKDIDAAFHFGEGSWAGALTDVLMPEYVVPLGHPDLLAEKDAIGLQALLLKYPLLQASSRPNFWTHWLRETEYEHPSPHSGPRFEHFHMVIRAAASKMGIALLPRFLVEDEILAQQSGAADGPPCALDRKLLFRLSSGKARQPQSSDLQNLGHARSPDHKKRAEQGSFGITLVHDKPSETRH